MLLNITVVAIAITLFYSLIIFCKKRDALWDWWHILVSTLVSVTLAMAGGIKIFRMQSSEQDAQERAQWKMLVAAEFSEMTAGLSGNPMNINFPAGAAPEQVPIYITYVQPIAAERAALSGKFNRSTSEKLLQLAEATRAYDMKATYALQLLAQGNISPNYAERVAHASFNLSESRKNILAYLLEVNALMANDSGRR